MFPDDQDRIRASEVWFIRGRIAYPGYDGAAPFPVALAIYNGLPVKRKLGDLFDEEPPKKGGGMRDSDIAYMNMMAKNANEPKGVD